MLNDILFEYETNCPVCDHKCQVLRARSSRLVVERRDPDFCVYYAGIDPYLYNIWVCADCGYVGTESDFLSGLSDSTKNILKEFLQDKNVKFTFKGERTLAQAIILHLWAIKLAEASKAKSSCFASLNLKLAWLYRKSYDSAKERKCLSKALDFYIKAYDEEALPLGKMTELMLSYLIGELSRSTFKYQDAVRWFSRVVSSSQGQYEPGVVRMAREQWLVTREEVKNINMNSEKAEKTEKIEKTRKDKSINTNAVYKNKHVHRIMLSKKVNLYEDDIHWLKKTLSAITGRKLILNTDAILRAVVAVVKDIEVDKKITTEEELTDYLVEKILQSKNLK